MPINDHLQFLDITDFSPGLFGEVSLVANQLLVPQNGFAKLLNYVPQKGGGLRPFYAIDATLSCSGRVTPSQEIATGLYARGSAGVGGTDHLLTTHNGTDHKSRLYRLNGTGTVPATTWSVPTNGTSAASSSDSVAPVDFDFFNDSAGNSYYVMVVRTNAVATWSGGVKWLAYVTMGYVYDGGGIDGVLTHRGSYSGPLAVSGGRVIVGDGVLGYRLRYTDVGLPTFTAASTQYVDIDANTNEAGMRGIAANSPSDLLIMRGGAPWYQLSGDIGSTSLSQRSMGDEHHGKDTFQRPVRVPGGIAFIEPGGYIYVTDGRTFNNISANLPPFATGMTGGGAAVSTPGNLEWINGFLFAPGGRVLHWDTMSWFTIDETTAFHAAAQAIGQLIFVNQGLGGAVKQLDMYQGHSASRSRTATVQTAPFTDQGGRNVEIREVQVYLNAFGSAGSLVCSLIDGTDTSFVSRTITGIDAGRQMVKFQFPATKKKYVSVRLEADGGSGQEAHTIERVRVGFGPNNLIAGVG